ncbi:unnamed protein product [Rhizophagus irregularis]|nr:unnamed protein product [Rhizophagus irregularis]
MSSMMNMLNNTRLPESEDNVKEIYYITKQMTVKTIIHSLTPIEYPPTSKEGVAIVYHIQYSMGKPCGQHTSTCSYLGDVTIEKKDRTCQGVKIYLQLKVNKEMSEDNIENVTFAVYLAAFKTKCRYMRDGVQYAGKSILKCLKRKDNTTTYFIGCSEWNFNEKFHRFINIKENSESEEPTNDCYTILPNSSKKTLCSHPHHTGTTIKQGSIIQKISGVKYSKIIPLDIKSCPYVILISKRIHSHPPPPPSRVPLTIRLRNLIKTYFGTDYLSEVHSSLNNNDHLRYYVDKIQKEIHPQGQGLLGVVYNYSRNINNFCDYVKRLGKN